MPVLASLSISCFYGHTPFSFLNGDCLITAHERKLCLHVSHRTIEGVHYISSVSVKVFTTPSVLHMVIDGICWECSVLECVRTSQGPYVY